MKYKIRIVSYRCELTCDCGIQLKKTRMPSVFSNITRECIGSNPRLLLSLVICPARILH